MVGADVKAVVDFPQGGSVFVGCLCHLLRCVDHEIQDAALLLRPVVLANGQASVGVPIFSNWELFLSQAYLFGKDPADSLSFFVMRVDLVV